ncbi:hypothetical protein Sm713_27660 [Streptomyces sp. TS71-3]|nr:hypothetical protein Sm713_27660 [Streptomyces sp. TS71-3]
MACRITGVCTVLVREPPTAPPEARHRPPGRVVTAAQIPRTEQGTEVEVLVVDRVLIPALLTVVKALGILYWFAWRRWRPEPARDAFVYRWGTYRQPCGGPFCDGCDVCRPARTRDRVDLADQADRSDHRTPADTPPRVHV